MRTLRKRSRSQTDMSRDTTRHLLLHSFVCKELLFRLHILSILSFNARFSAMDFSNASSNARGRWVGRCLYFVFWITFYTLLLYVSELYVISGSNLLFSSTSLFLLCVKANILSRILTPQVFKLQYKYMLRSVFKKVDFIPLQLKFSFFKNLQGSRKIDVF